MDRNSQREIDFSKTSHHHHQHQNRWTMKLIYAFGDAKTQKISKLIDITFHLVWQQETKCQIPVRCRNKNLKDHTHGTICVFHLTCIAKCRSWEKKSTIQTKKNFVERSNGRTMWGALYYEVFYYWVYRGPDELIFLFSFILFAGSLTLQHCFNSTNHVKHCNLYWRHIQFNEQRWEIIFQWVW